MQKRTSPLNFDHFRYPKQDFTASNLSTKVADLAWPAQDCEFLVRALGEGAQVAQSGALRSSAVQLRNLHNGQLRISVYGRRVPAETGVRCIAGMNWELLYTSAQLDVGHSVERSDQ